MFILSGGFLDGNMTSIITVLITSISGVLVAYLSKKVSKDIKKQTDENEKFIKLQLENEELRKKNEQHRIEEDQRRQSEINSRLERIEKAVGDLTEDVQKLKKLSDDTNLPEKLKQLHRLDETNLEYSLSLGKVVSTICNTLVGVSDMSESAKNKIQEDMTNHSERTTDILNKLYKSNDAYNV